MLEHASLRTGKTERGRGPRAFLDHDRTYSLSLCRLQVCSKARRTRARLTVSDLQQIPTASRCGSVAILAAVRIDTAGHLLSDGIGQAPVTTYETIGSPAFLVPASAACQADHGAVPRRKQVLMTRKAIQICTCPWPQASSAIGGEGFGGPTASFQTAELRIYLLSSLAAAHKPRQVSLRAPRDGQHAAQRCVARAPAGA
jgi:hypothetical protein